MGGEALSIDKKTRVELYAVLACVPFAVGAILWAASIDSKASAAVKGVNDLQPIAIELIRETSSLKTEIRNLREELERARRR